MKEDNQVLKNARLSCAGMDRHAQIPRCAKQLAPGEKTIKSRLGFSSQPALQIKNITTYCFFFFAAGLVVFAAGFSRPPMSVRESSALKGN